MTRKTKLVIDPETDVSVKREYVEIATEYGSKHIPVYELLVRMKRIYSNRKAKEVTVDKEKEV